MTRLEVSARALLVEKYQHHSRFGSALTREGAQSYAEIMV